MLLFRPASPRTCGKPISSHPTIMPKPSVEQIKRDSRHLRGQIAEPSEIPASPISTKPNTSFSNSTAPTSRTTATSAPNAANRNRTKPGASWSAPKCPAASSPPPSICSRRPRRKPRQRHPPPHHPAGHPVPRHPQRRPERPHRRHRRLRPDHLGRLRRRRPQHHGPRRTHQRRRPRRRRETRLGTQRHLPRPRPRLRRIWLDGEQLRTAPTATVANPPEERNLRPALSAAEIQNGHRHPAAQRRRLFSQDIAFVPHLPNGQVDGYTLSIGGGFGMTHGKTETRPVLAKPFAYVDARQVVAVTEAIVIVQREYGNRKDRKQARLKYSSKSTASPWFRNARSASVTPAATLHPPKEVAFDTVADMLGWHEQGDGKLFCGVHVAQGRIADSERTAPVTAGLPRHRPESRPPHPRHPQHQPHLRRHRSFPARNRQRHSRRTQRPPGGRTHRRPPDRARLRRPAHLRPRPRGERTHLRRRARQNRRHPPRTRSRRRTPPHSHDRLPQRLRPPLQRRHRLRRPRPRKYAMYSAAPAVATASPDWKRRRHPR